MAAAELALLETGTVSAIDVESTAPLTEIGVVAGFELSTEGDVVGIVKEGDDVASTGVEAVSKDGGTPSP